jgi:uncharacterized membrane protein YjfL (UPF0719 family)
MDWVSLAAGLVAFGVALLTSVLLVFVTYRLTILVTKKIDEERLLLEGNRSVALALGAVVLSEAILMRHAVFPTMAVVRNVVIRPLTLAATAWAVGCALIFFAIVGVLSFVSVVIAAWLFSKMTRALPEREEILKDNLAVAILFALVVVAITLVVNEGVVDLTRSIIPYPESGVVQIQ